MTTQEFARRADACAARMYAIAYLTLRSEADCEDAVQEALLRAWRGLASLRDEKLFETWLIRICINESRRLLRRRARRAELPFEEAAFAAVAPPRDPALRDALRALELRFRLPLVLHYIDGYTEKETAAILRLPVSTVKWRLHEGRARLRAELEEKEIDR